MSSWLSSLAGSVASTVISASTQALTGNNNVPGLNGYTLGDKVYQFDRRSIWLVYDGMKKDDSTPVTIFSYQLNPPPDTSNNTSYSSTNDRQALLLLAKNALKKLRALRHPHILKFLDGIETDSSVWIVTEPVRSLSLELDSTSSNTTSTLSEESKLFGLLHLVTALSFLNKDGASIHGNLKPESVWITSGGEWKLAGMELTTRKDDDQGVLWNYAGLVPEARTVTSPEVRKAGSHALKEHDASALDSYQLYLFIFVIFNGSLPPTFSSPSDSLPALPTTRGLIPQTVYTTWRRLGNPNPKARLRTDQFLQLGIGSESGGLGWWPQNRLVKLSAALEGFSLASEGEKMDLLKTLKEVSDTTSPAMGGAARKSSSVGGANDPLPDGFLKYKILPSLVRTFEFGGGGPALLPVILNLSSGLPEKEYATSIIQPLVRMFATPDRAMRMALLEGLEKFADKLTNKDVTEKIWPHLLTGFGDVVPVIREATVKSILLIAPKLSERILNNDLLRLLARSQTDPEPGIRTNTCILLGRLSRHLQPSTNRKVLVPAFARALRDPFIHARIAGLMALMATAEVYEKEDLAGKVIPAMSICLIDREKPVRDQAYKAIDLFVKKCEALTANMSETPATIDENGNPIVAPAGPGGGIPGGGTTNSVMALKAAGSTQPGLATNAAGAAGALAGWAFASVSKKLSTAEMATPIERRDSVNPSIAPPPPSSSQYNGSSAPSGSPPTLGRASMDRAARRPFQSSSLASSLPGGFDQDEQQEEEEDEGPEDWGKDLIDVHADEDDWDRFESGASIAPTTNVAQVDPLAARLSSAKPKKVGGALKLGGKLNGSSLGGGFKVPSDSWDMEQDASTSVVVKPASLANVRKPAPNLMASAVPAAPKQIVSLAPRPTRAPIQPPASPIKKPANPVIVNQQRVPIRTTLKSPPLSPPRVVAQFTSTTSTPPPPPIENPFADLKSPSAVDSIGMYFNDPPPAISSSPPPTPPRPLPLTSNRFETTTTTTSSLPIHQSLIKSPISPSSSVFSNDVIATTATGRSSIETSHEDRSNGTLSPQPTTTTTTTTTTTSGGGGATAGGGGESISLMTKEEKMAQAREQRRLRMALAKAGKK